MIKKIKDFPNYFITSNGDVYSSQKGYMKKMSPFKDSQKRYMMIKIKHKNGKYYHKLIHRLVAEAFIENKNNYPEVDHINDICDDNRVENLQWCTRKQNVHKEYKKMSPIRNKKKCALYKGGKLLFLFNSIIDASRYAFLKYGISITSLSKYHHVGNFVVVEIDNDKEVKKNIPFKNKKSINKNEILLLRDNYIVYQCSTVNELIEFFKKYLKADYNRYIISKYINKDILFNGFLIRR